MIIGINGYIGSGKDTVGKIVQFLTRKRKGDNWHTHGWDKEMTSIISQMPNPDWDNVFTWEVKKYAAKLKQIASILTGIPVEKFEDQEFKKTYMPQIWDRWTIEWKHGDDGPGKAMFVSKEEAEKFMEMYFEDGVEEDRIVFSAITVREFLQQLGTEAMRDVIHPNVWVNALMADYKVKPHSLGLADMSSYYPDWIVTDVRFPNEAQAIKDRGGYVVRVNRSGTGPTLEDIAAGRVHPSEVSLDYWDFDFTIQNDGNINELNNEVKWMLNKFGQL